MKKIIKIRKEKERNEKNLIPDKLQRKKMDRKDIFLLPSMAVFCKQCPADGSFFSSAFTTNPDLEQRLIGGYILQASYSLPVLLSRFI